MESDELVVASTYTSAIEANIALGMLRTNGIACVLNGELINNVLGGIHVTPVDGIRLMVRESDLPLAKKLLTECDDL